MNDWLALLKADIAKSGSIDATANKLGYSRAAISLVMRDKYQGNPAKIIARILERCSPVACPHLGEEITEAMCRGYRERPHPISSSMEAAHWRACRRCPNNPACKGKI